MVPEGHWEVVLDKEVEMVLVTVAVADCPEARVTRAATRASRKELSMIGLLPAGGEGQGRRREGVWVWGGWGVSTGWGFGCRWVGGGRISPEHTWWAPGSAPASPPPHRAPGSPKRKSLTKNYNKSGLRRRRNTLRSS